MSELHIVFTAEAVRYHTSRAFWCLDLRLTEDAVILSQATTSMEKIYVMRYLATLKAGHSIY